jgi:hypothetical protein
VKELLLALAMDDALEGMVAEKRSGLEALIATASCSRIRRWSWRGMLMREHPPEGYQHDPERQSHA